MIIYLRNREHRTGNLRVGKLQRKWHHRVSGGEIIFLIQYLATSAKRAFLHLWERHSNSLRKKILNKLLFVKLHL